ncbi:MAG: hypothetical protein ABI673_11270 [Novosphingobium sp.]
MALKFRKDRLAILLIAAVLLVAALAWRNAGREPLHEISEPVAVPGSASGIGR